MTQQERRIFLIKELLSEQPRYSAMEIPKSEREQTVLLRSLLNLRMPKPVSHAFLNVQDAYLQEAIKQKDITRLTDLQPVQPDLYLWQGDITTLCCDAIVNAANSGMLGCFCPNHGCIDNAIHTFAGVQLRLACADLMNKQGHAEETGKAKITPAFNLPCKYILHTVGPIVKGRLTKKEQEALASCYRSCLELAEKNGVKSIALCCISTGEYRFPQAQAAKIAVQTVIEYKKQAQSEMEVIFNVYKETDYSIYRALLRTN